MAIANFVDGTDTYKDNITKTNRALHDLHVLMTPKVLDYITLRLAIQEHTQNTCTTVIFHVTRVTMNMTY